MIRLRRRQVIAIGSRSARSRTTVVYRRHRLESNSPPSGAEAVGELSLVPVRDTHEIFVESAELQRKLSLDGEVRSDELVNPRSVLTRESRGLVTRSTGALLPRLNDAAGHHRSGRLGMCAPMSADKRRVWDDIIVDKERDFARGLEQAAIHGSCHARRLLTNPLDNSI